MIMNEYVWAQNFNLLQSALKVLHLQYLYVINP